MKFINEENSLDLTFIFASRIKQEQGTDFLPVFSKQGNYFVAVVE